MYDTYVRKYQCVCIKEVCVTGAKQRKRLVGMRMLDTDPYVIYVLYVNACIHICMAVCMYVCSCSTLPPPAYAVD